MNLKRLYGIGKARVPKHDLENMERLLPYLDHPEKKCRFIHIAGSNGKGTTAFQIAESLRLAGHNVGLFTSPHISSFRERIQLNNTLISEEEVTTYLNDIFSVIDQHNLSATFFEITTCLALLYFADTQPDIAIMEVGLGGRADATNVIHPLISVITSISLEHTEILGHTIEDIAREKAGIIKPGIPVIIGKTVPLSVVSPLTDHLIPSLGNIARCTLDTLGWPYDLRGLEMRPPCRFEEIGPYILDVAHNPESCRRLITHIKQKYPDRKISCLFSFSKPKTLGPVLKVLGPHVQQFWMFDSPHDRILPAKMLQKKAMQMGFPSTLCRKITDCHHDLLVVCGSFYMMREIRRQLGLNDVQDSF